MPGDLEPPADPRNMVVEVGGVMAGWNRSGGGHHEAATQTSRAWKRVVMRVGEGDIRSRKWVGSAAVAAAKS